MTENNKVSDNTMYDVFEDKNISKAIFKLALPTIISQLITTIYNLADTFWVGRLNDSFQLAALSVVFPMQLALTAIGNLFGLGAGSCISNAYGAKDFKKVHSASSFAFYFGIFTTLLLVLFVALFRNETLSLLASNDTIDEYVNSYLNWVIVLGSIPQVINMIIANMIRAEGYSFYSSMGLSLGGILNIILDPFFVLPQFLNFQIKGAAIATLISNLVTTLYFILLLIKLRKKTILSFNFNDIFKTRKIGREVIFTGIPSCLQTLLSAVSNLVLNSLVMSYNEFAEAAIGITKKIDAIPFGVITGLSQGAAPLIAYNNGAKKHQNMLKVLKKSLIYCLFVSAFILLGIEVFAGNIISLFAKNEETLAYGTKFLRLHCVSMIFIAVTFMMVAFFQSVGSKLKAFILSFIRKGLFDIPLMFLLNILIPLYGIVLCQPIMDIVSCIIAVLFFILWKKDKNIINKEVIYD